jgi:thioredoxin 1
MKRDKRTRELTDEDFEAETHRSLSPVLVEFWAEWSGTCHIMAPIVESIEKSLTGLVKVVRMNIETCPRTATQFSVRKVPTLLLFQMGELVDVLSGMMSREELARRVKRKLKERRMPRAATPNRNHNY